MTDEEKAKIFTLKLLNITEEKFDLVMFNYNNELLEENVIMYVYNTYLAGLNANAERITKLEKENAEAKELLKTFLLIADNKVSQMGFQLLVADAKQFLKECRE